MTDSDIYQRETSPNQIYLREVSWCQHRGHIHRLQQVVASWSRGAFAPRPCWQQCHDWPTPRGARLRHVLSAVGFVSQLQMPSECISQGLFCG